MQLLLIIGIQTIWVATRSDIITIEDAIFNYGLANDPDVIRLRQIVKENSGSSIKQSSKLLTLAISISHFTYQF